MLKHLTPETIATPSHAWLGFLSPNVAQAACIVKFQEYCSTCQEMNLKDALENQSSASRGSKGLRSPLEPRRGSLGGH